MINVWTDTKKLLAWLGNYRLNEFVDNIFTHRKVVIKWQTKGEQSKSMEVF